MTLEPPARVWLLPCQLHRELYWAPGAEIMDVAVFQTFPTTDGPTKQINFSCFSQCLMLTV